MLALRECAARGVDFGTAFRYQYVISRHPLEAPGMEVHPFAGLHIATGQALRVSRLRDARGMVFGLLMGIAVDAGGVLGADCRLPDIDPAADDPFGALELWLEDLAGRYVLVAALGGQLRLYGDPSGMIGVVYNRQLKRVGASPYLVIDDEVIERPDYDHAAIAERGAKYTLFDTRDRRVRRLNPNFWLDLKKLRTGRFWPRPDQTFALAPHEVARAYSAVIAGGRHVTEALIAAAPCALPLSGGRDSRLIAGFAQGRLGRVRQVFTHVTNYGTRKDAALAGHVAQALRTEHEVHDHRGTTLTPDELARETAIWQVATGIDSAPPNEVRTGVNRSIEDDALILRGHQTDILRAVFLDRPGEAGRRSLAWQVKRLMPVPYAEFNRRVFLRFVARYRAWLDSLPACVRHKSVDMMFAEIYYPSSLGVTFPGLTRHFYLSSFNSRRMIGLAMSFDDDARLRSHVVDDLLYRMNPALHHVPLDYEAGSLLDDLEDSAYRRAVVRARLARTAARAPFVADRTAQEGAGRRTGA